MRTLIYKQHKEFKKILKDLSELHSKFRDLSFGFESFLLKVIEEGLTLAEQSNRLNLKNKIESLKTDYRLVNSGIDPRTHETILRNRRRIIQEVSHYIIRELERSIVSEFERLEGLISRAEDSIGQIILSGLQTNKLKTADLVNTLNLQNTNILIRQLNEDDSIKLMNQKLLLTFHPVDLKIIYREVICKICQINHFEIND